MEYKDYFCYAIKPSLVRSEGDKTIIKQFRSLYPHMCPTIIASKHMASSPTSHRDIETCFNFHENEDLCNKLKKNTLLEVPEVFWPGQLFSRTHTPPTQRQQLQLIDCRQQIVEKQRVDLRLIFTHVDGGTSSPKCALLTLPLVPLSTKAAKMVQRIAAERREQSVGSRRQAVGGRLQAVGYRRQAIEGRLQAVGYRQQAIGGRLQEVGYRRQAICGRLQVAGYRRYACLICTN